MAADRRPILRELLDLEHQRFTSFEYHQVRLDLSESSSYGEIAMLESESLQSLSEVEARLSFVPEFPSGIFRQGLHDSACTR